MARAYKLLVDAPEGVYILARETDDGYGIVWEEWSNTEPRWQRSEWACDAFHGFGDYAVNNVIDISEGEALKIMDKNNFGQPTGTVSS